MSQIRHALIMAAGRGQRMYPLTDVIPKPMAPIDGSTLIAKGIAGLSKHIANVHVTVGYKGSVLAKHVIELGVSSIFRTEGHGNAWWIFHTLIKELYEPVYVLTCDNLIDLDFSLLEKSYFDLGSPACMLVPVKPVEGLEGDFIFHDKQIVSEVNRQKKSDIYASGMQILNPGKINQMMDVTEDFYTVWNNLIERKQLMVASVYPKTWIAVDTVDQLNRAAGKMVAS